MTVIALRFDGSRQMPRGGPQRDAWLVSLLGHDGGPSPEVGGAFGMTCLLDGAARMLLPGFLRSVLEVDASGGAACSEETLARSFGVAGGDPRRTRLAVVATRPDGTTARFAAGGASVEAAVA
jgi:hypothetical protein